MDDVANRLGNLNLSEETVSANHFQGSTLESQAAEQAATLLLLISAEREALEEISFLEMQKRIRRLQDRGITITLETLIKGIQQLDEPGFLSMREEGQVLLLKPSVRLLEAVQNPHEHI